MKNATFMRISTRLDRWHDGDVDDRHVSLFTVLTELSKSESVPYVCVHMHVRLCVCPLVCVLWFVWVCKRTQCCCANSMRGVLCMCCRFEIVRSIYAQKMKSILKMQHHKYKSADEFYERYQTYLDSKRYTATCDKSMLLCTVPQCFVVCPCDVQVHAGHGNRHEGLTLVGGGAYSRGVWNAGHCLVFT